MKQGNTLLQKLLWRVAPNTMYQVWSDAHRTGFQKGVDEGREIQRELVESRLREHNLKDFGDPSLTLGYAHAVKAMRGEIDEVV